MKQKFTGTFLDSSEALPIGRSVSETKPKSGMPPTNGGTILMSTANDNTKVGDIITTTFTTTFKTCLHVRVV